MIGITDDFIEKYSNKMLGDAFLKIKDSFLAEDLAQERLFQWGCSRKKNPMIECTDCYV